MTESTRLSALRRADPARARRELTRALKQAHGNVTHAARRLGLSHRTLCRWLAADPDLRAAKDQAARDVIAKASRKGVIPNSYDPDVIAKTPTKLGYALSAMTRLSYLDRDRDGNSA